MLFGVGKLERNGRADLAAFKRELPYERVDRRLLLDEKKALSRPPLYPAMAADAASAAPLTGDARYEEIESTLKAVVQIFSDNTDVAAVRETGKMMADLHATQEARHQEMLEDIRALTGQLQRAKQDHVERKSTLLDETQKKQLLAERSRVDENIKRLVLVRRRAISKGTRRGGTRAARPDSPAAMSIARARRRRTA